jgi:hypothetical protein
MGGEPRPAQEQGERDDDRRNERQRKKAPVAQCCSLRLAASREGGTVRLAFDVSGPNLKREAAASARTPQKGAARDLGCKGASRFI